METDQEEQQKHRCKVCAKIFYSGRSLGGHMRSHVHSSPPITGEKEKLERSRVQVSLRLGYGLRENPKKTFRLSDFIGEDHHDDDDDDDSWKQCRECDKAFPSWKALCGHMRCHSERTYPRSCFGDDEQEQSLGDDKSSMGSFADDNEPLLPVPRRKRRSKRASPAIVSVVTTGSSSSLPGYEPEQEEVAISLMMLSRDVSEFSDKNSWVLDAEEEEDDSVDESLIKIPISALLRKKRPFFYNNGHSFNGFNVMGSRFQCVTCKKSFHSYHALGGHRANHKRSKSCCSQNTIFNTGQSTPATAQKTRLHECDLCGKIFSSGQALGGHKRSHLVSNCGGENGGVDHQAAEAQNPLSAATTVDVSEPLDLNLPAPADELSSNLKAWWAGVRRT